MIYAVETNLIQRGFRDLKISEQAFAVAMRYKRLFDEKKLAAIDEELNIIHGEGVFPLGTPRKGNSIDLAAEDYGISHTTVARLIRMNDLNDSFKKLVDTDNIKIRPAVELSYLSQE